MALRGTVVLRKENREKRRRTEYPDRVSVVSRLGRLIHDELARRKSFGFQPAGAYASRPRSRGLLLSSPYEAACSHQRRWMARRLLHRRRCRRHRRRHCANMKSIESRVHAALSTCRLQKIWRRPGSPFFVLIDISVVIRTIDCDSLESNPFRCARRACTLDLYRV